MASNNAYRETGRLLSLCEKEADFWPNSRYFFELGEWEMAFEGLYSYLLERDDLWEMHHATIRKLKKAASVRSDLIEFLTLEEEALDRRHSTEAMRLKSWGEET